MLYMDEVKVLNLFGYKRYSQVFPGIPVLYETSYFIQFDAFIVHLPITDIFGVGDGLNIFEETVLKLLAIGRFTPDRLADELCLSEDFIVFIVSALREKGFLEKGDDSVSEKGLNYLGVQNDRKTAAVSYVPYYVLCRRDTGDIIPMLFQRESIKLGEADFNNLPRRIIIRSGTAGNEKPVSIRMVAIKRQHNKRNLTRKEIERILTYYNRFSNRQIKISELGEVESSFEPYSIFAHLKFVVQNGDIDHILSSVGIQSHFAGFLQYINAIRHDFAGNILKKAQNYIAKAPEEKENGRKHGKYSYLAEKLSLPQNQVSNNADARARQDAESSGTIAKYLSAIEVALDIYLQQIEIPDSLLNSLHIQNAVDNGKLLFQMAQNLGIRGMDVMQPLFHIVSYESVKKWQRGGEPSLHVLFPLACGVQYSRPSQQFLSALSVLEPEVLMRLFSYGKIVRHGGRLNLEKGDSVENIHDRVEDFVKSLLPDFSGNTGMQLVNKTAMSATEQRLNARVWLLNSLGDEIYSNIPDKEKKQLERSFIVSSTVDANLISDFLLAISSALELELVNITHFLNIVRDMSVVQRRLEEKGGLPHGLSRVNPKYYELAASGRSATLGAYALAFAGTLPEPLLINAIRHHIFENINDIAEARGHGTGWKDFSKDELIRLRKKTIETIKFLEEMKDIGGIENV